MSYFSNIMPCMGRFQVLRYNEVGQSMIEYMLLVAIIVVIAMSALDLYTSSLGEFYQLITTTFEKLSRHISL